MATQPPGPALATPPMSPLPTLLCVPPHTPTTSADTPRSFLSQGGGSYVLSPLPGPISQVGHVGLSSCHLLQEAFSDQFFQANALYLFPLLKKKKKKSSLVHSTPCNYCIYIYCPNLAPTSDCEHHEGASRTVPGIQQVLNTFLVI